MKNIKTLKFWAPWCKPCTALSVQLEDLEIESYNIDTPQGAAKAAEFKIRNIPALVFLEIGEDVDVELHRHLGMISRQAYLDTVDALAYEKINPDYQEMVENLGSPKAESIYTQVIDFRRGGVDSLSFICGQEKMFPIYGKFTDNLESFVSMLNTQGEFRRYGTYFNNGDGRVRLELVPEEMKKLKESCTSGELSLEAFWD